MRVTIKTIIDKPAEKLFWLSQDYTRRLDWDSYLVEANLLHNKTQAAIGVESFCKNKSGSVLISRYISFSPPTHAAVEMTRGPWILAKFGGTWRFNALADNLTEVRFIYNFKCRPSVLRWLLEPIVGLLYKRDMQRRLVAFKSWSESKS
jgi:hypothetical protein